MSTLADYPARSPWRALTVRPPWSWAIVHGHKKTENRTGWHFHWRGPLLIQAAATPARFDAHQRALLEDAYGEWIPPFERVGGLWVHPSERDPDWSRRIEVAAAIGCVYLHGVHEAMPGCCDDPWAEDQFTEANTGRRRKRLFHLELRHPIAFPDSVYAKGREGLWIPSDELLQDCGLV